MAKVTGLDNVLKNLDKEIKRQGLSAELAGARTGIQLQSYARANRPWRDRTNQARLTTKGSSDVRGTKVIAALAIGVFYGVYLETGYAGRWGIIDRTILANRHALAENMKKIHKL